MHGYRDILALLKFIYSLVKEARFTNDPIVHRLFPSFLALALMLYICLMLYSTGCAFSDRYEKRYEKIIFLGIVTMESLFWVCFLSAGGPRESRGCHMRAGDGRGKLDHYYGLDIAL